MILKRENPRRTVMHYESPPRKRLREQEDAILAGYIEQISAEKEQQANEAPNP
jgi:hypothetical protein